jgi:uncharacterized protein with PIN domain
MVIDTSALIAILFAEPDREFFLSALEQPGPKLLSAVNSLEAAIVVEARNTQLAYGPKLRSFCGADSPVRGRPPGWPLLIP